MSTEVWQLEPMSAARLLLQAVRSVFLDYNPDEPRDARGQWSREGGGAQGEHPETIEQYLRGEKIRGDAFFQSKGYGKWERDLKTGDRAHQSEIAKLEDKLSDAYDNDNVSQRTVDKLERKINDLERDGSDLEFIQNWTDDAGESWQQERMAQVFRDAPKFSGIVYRGDSVGRFGNAKVGQTVRLTAFVPSSRNPNVASGFADKILLRVKLKRGMAIERISNFKSEKEVVMPPGRYKINRIYRTKYDRVRIIEMRQR